MIDLEKPLKREVRCDGGWVKVKTDFRVWLTFSRLLRSGFIWKGVLSDPEVQVEGWQEGALEFFRSENPLPRGEGGERVLDYTVDSDLLVGAFFQAYGVDLTSCEMHWHVFCALVRSLPGTTKLSEVMGYRAWRKTNRKTDEVYAELKEKWALPMPEEEREAALRWQQEAFGRCLM